MKTRFGEISFRLLVLCAWGGLAFILTTQSDHLPLVHIMTITIGSTEVGDALGHMGLFAVLTFVAYMVVTLWAKPVWALPPVMTGILLLGIITELAQFGVLNRAPSVSDLLANSLGVFVVGFVIGFGCLLRSRHTV